MENDFVQEYLYIEEYPIPIKKEEKKNDDDDNRGVIIIDIFGNE